MSTDKHHLPVTRPGRLNQSSHKQLKEENLKLQYEIHGLISKREKKEVERPKTITQEMRPDYPIHKTLDESHHVRFKKPIFVDEQTKSNKDIHELEKTRSGGFKRKSSTHKDQEDLYDLQTKQKRDDRLGEEISRLSSESFKKSKQIKTLQTQNMALMHRNAQLVDQMATLNDYVKVLFCKTQELRTENNGFISTIAELKNALERDYRIE